MDATLLELRDDRPGRCARLGLAGLDLAGLVHRKEATRRGRPGRQAGPSCTAGRRPTQARALKPGSPTST